MAVWNVHHSWSSLLAVERALYCTCIATLVIECPGCHKLFDITSISDNKYTTACATQNNSIQQSYGDNIIIFIVAISTHIGNILQLSVNILEPIETNVMVVFDQFAETSPILDYIFSAIQILCLLFSSLDNVVPFTQILLCYSTKISYHGYFNNLSLWHLIYLDALTKLTTWYQY